MGERIKLARTRAGLTQDQVARKLGIARNNVSTWESGETRPASNRLIDLALMLGTTVPWLLSGDGAEPVQREKSTEGHRRARPSGQPAPDDSRIPILGAGRGGDDGRFEFNGQVVGYTARPTSLIGVPDSYAVYVVGDSMEPRYRAGEIAQVNPHKPPVPGRDVVVQIKPTESGVPGEGLIKEFVKRTPTYVVLRQYNPPKEIELEERIVDSVHLIVGRADE